MTVKLDPPRFYLQMRNLISSFLPMEGFLKCLNDTSPQNVNELLPEPPMRGQPMCQPPQSEFTPEFRAHTIHCQCIITRCISV